MEKKIWKLVIGNISSIFQTSQFLPIIKTMCAIIFTGMHDPASSKLKPLSHEIVIMYLECILCEGASYWNCPIGFGRICQAAFEFAYLLLLQVNEEEKKLFVTKVTNEILGSLGKSLQKLQSTHPVLSHACKLIVLLVKNEETLSIPPCLKALMETDNVEPSEAVHCLICNGAMQLYCHEKAKKEGDNVADDAVMEDEAEESAEEGKNEAQEERGKVAEIDWICNWPGHLTDQSNVTHNVYGCANMTTKCEWKICELCFQAKKVYTW
jgi:hypothetical protein